MSLTPEQAPSATQKTWPRRLLHITLALFTLEIGLFLTVFPWTEYWHFNYFQMLFPALQDVWDQLAFRGAFTGLGIVNICLACMQVAQAFRLS
jgi:hypothetical protein